MGLMTVASITLSADQAATTASQEFMALLAMGQDQDAVAQLAPYLTFDGEEKMPDGIRQAVKAAERAAKLARQAASDLAMALTKAGRAAPALVKDQTAA